MEVIEAHVSAEVAAVIHRTVDPGVFRHQPESYMLTGLVGGVDLCTPCVQSKGNDLCFKS